MDDKEARVWAYEQVVDDCPEMIWDADKVFNAAHRLSQWVITGKDDALSSSEHRLPKSHALPVNESDLNHEALARMCQTREQACEALKTLGVNDWMKS